MVRSEARVTRASLGREPAAGLSAPPAPVSRSVLGSVRSNVREDRLRDFRRSSGVFGSCRRYSIVAM
eukprot:9499578-Pyramimonas_sp.AAC.1